MDDIPDQNDSNEALEHDIITSKRENRPVWMQVLFFCGNKLLYAFLNVLVYFTNRGIFALKAVGSFNFILIGFAVAEWWLYHYAFTELAFQILHYFKSNNFFN